MSVRILTDSASDLLPENDLGVRVLPMRITFDGQEYQDGVTLSHAQFYERLVECEALPVTSQIGPYDFECAFREASQAGDEVVVITMSGKLSGTCQSARMAAEAFGETVFVVDSESVSVGERILVRYACALQAQGLNAAEIAARLEQKKSSIAVVALLDTLEYLKKGGRISKAAAFAGGVLSIKPVVAIEGGEVVILGKARGSRQGNNMLMEMVRKKGGIDFSMPIALGYTGLSDAMLRKYLEDSAPLYEGRDAVLPCSSIGGTIGTHAGPGAVAVAFFSAEADHD